MRRRRSTLDVTYLDCDIEDVIMAIRVSPSKLCVRSSTNLALEESRYHLRTLHHNNFQLVDYWGTFSADRETRYFCAAIEEN